VMMVNTVKMQVVRVTPALPSREVPTHRLPTPKRQAIFRRA
jgi:hypothetical protein